MNSLVDETTAPKLSMPVYHVANLFPLVDGAEFDELCADVKTHGLRHPIVLWKGQILDGRNRLRACEAVDVKPRFVDYDGDDPVGYVVSVNLQRRHLSTSQRAMLAARLSALVADEDQARERLAHAKRRRAIEDAARRAQGRSGLPNVQANADAPSKEGADVSSGIIAKTRRHHKQSVGNAARLNRVSAASVERAITVLKHGAPELVAAVDRGAISISDAAELSRKPHVDQVAAVETASYVEAEAGASAADSPSPIPLFPTGHCAVIYADPPWRCRETDGAASTLSDDDIEAVGVKGAIAADAVLFLWSPPSRIDVALRVLRSWGFRYETELIWERGASASTGRFSRPTHETLLVGVRGEMLPKERDSLPRSVIHAPAAPSSTKPPMHGLIERMFPDGPYLDVFAADAASDRWSLLSRR